LSQPKAKATLEREEPRVGFLTLLSLVIGFVASYIAFVLYHLIGLVTNAFYYSRLSFSFASPQFSHLGPLAIALPVVGGLIAGLMIKYGSTKIIGHGIPETMESILVERSKISPKVGILKAVSAAVTIGSGQPFGAEGPIIQTGGAFGSFVGQVVSMTGTERRVLLATGAAAGMAATFGTPVAGILLAVELLLFEFRVKSLVPVAVGSAIGGWMHIYLISPQPLFQTPAYGFGGLATLPFYAGLGLLCGVLGSALSRGLYQAESAFSKLKVGQPWLPAIGGLAVGVIGFGAPQVLGVGYNVISSILNGQFAVDIVLVILVAKSAAWLLAMGSQTSGGTLAPLFMIGGSSGYLFGMWAAALLPSLGVGPGAFAIAGMAAVFGAASRAPLTSIVFALEVTRDFQGAMPVIVTVAVAGVVGEVLMEDSIMTERLARRGLRVRNIYEYNPLRQVSIGAIMSAPVVCVEADRTVTEIKRWMEDPGHPYSMKKRLVVVSDGRAVGVLEKAITESALADGTTARDVCSRDFEAMPQEESAYYALRRMALRNVSFVVVTDSEDKVVGYLSRGDLVGALRNKVEDETIVERRGFSRAADNPALV
jgi:H+/Cl- antiporter ClcA